MTVKERIKAIPGEVKDTVTGAWGMLRFALNPDDPRSMNMVIKWAFGRLNANDLVKAINTRQDLASEFQHWMSVDASTQEKNIALSVINAQWINIQAVLMNPQLILDYFERYEPSKYAYLNTPQGKEYLNWICPRFHDTLRQYVYTPNHKKKK